MFSEKRAGEAYNQKRKTDYLRNMKSKQLVAEHEEENRRRINIST
jgi:hypothetical protein